MLDNDDGGRPVTARLQAAFGARAIPVDLPHGVKDPADLAPHSDGHELFCAAIDAATDRHMAAAGAHSVIPFVTVVS